MSWMGQACMHIDHWFSMHSASAGEFVARLTNCQYLSAKDRQGGLMAGHTCWGTYRCGVLALSCAQLLLHCIIGLVKLSLLLCHLSISSYTVPFRFRIRPVPPPEGAGGKPRGTLSPI